jgi:hypothetical protein
MNIQNLCLNNMNRYMIFTFNHDIDILSLQINEWHLCLFYANLRKINFALLLLSNHNPWNLWWLTFHFVPFALSKLSSSNMYRWENIEIFMFLFLEWIFQFSKLHKIFNELIIETVWNVAWLSPRFRFSMLWCSQIDKATKFNT